MSARLTFFSAPGLRRAAAALLWLGSIGSPSARAESPDMVAPEARAWTIVGQFEDRDEARNLSGVACATSRPAARSCLLVSDEKRYARLVTVEEGTIRLGATIPLLPAWEGGERFRDMDAEAAAFADGFYYVAGSHGVSRGGGRYERARFHLYRFPVDPGTGQPSFPMGGDEPAAQVERTNRLEPLLASIPDLKDHACTATGPCRRLQEGGVNIEGLAVREGSLYLGLRAPSLDGSAFVVRVGRDALFGAAQEKPQIFRLALGEGVGVRDLAAVGDGLLVLTGSAGPGGEDEAAQAAIYHWPGDAREAVRLGTLGGVAFGAKPEALLVLGEDESSYRVLVLSDGPDKGAPTEYRLPRRR